MKTFSEFYESLSAGEAVVGFASWLTTLSEPVVMSKRHDASKIAELVDKYLKAQGLSEPREGWEEELAAVNECKRRLNEAEENNNYAVASKVIDDLETYLKKAVERVEDKVHDFTVESSENLRKLITKLRDDIKKLR